MPIVPLTAIREEFVNRSKLHLERSLSSYETLLRINDNLTIEQNIISTSSELNKLSQTAIQDWYMEVLHTDVDFCFCSLTDKSYNNKVINFSRYDWLGLDKSRLENLMYLLSNSDTITSVDVNSMKLLSSQLQLHASDKREEIYRVIRILTITYNLELYNSILSLANFLYVQIHVNTLR